MKTNGFLQLFLVLTLGICHAPAQAQTQRKFAFLIAIGDYPQEGGWQKIHASNDLGIIRQALLNRGFPAENILTLTESEATYEGILKTWNERFVPKIRAGDVVYFQYSGHGQQVADDNGDEADRYDEAIVPYDSPLKYEAGVYTGERLIRDDKLNELFTDLRRKLGPGGNLMVVLDACHSGTGTRGMTPARGTDIPMASPEYVKSTFKTAAAHGDITQFGPPEGVTQLAPMAAFFGSAHNQLNFETRDEQGELLGSLSYALSKILSEASPNTSYRGLFDRIRLEMSSIAPRQQPQAEGTLDQELLGGRLLPKPAYHNVKTANDDYQIIVNAGTVQGLNEGAVLALYPGDSRDTSKKLLATGTVKQAFPFEATVDLDQPVPMEEAKKAWVYVKEQNFGALKLGISINLPEQNPVAQQLKKEITEKYKQVFQQDLPPEVFLIDSGPNLLLLGPGEIELAAFSKNKQPDQIVEGILDVLKGYTRIKYLRQMEATSPYLNVTFELIPMKAERLPGNRVIEKGPIPLEEKLDEQGILHLQDGDVFRIRVINNGRKAAYFALIDIQPDNVSSCLIPGQDAQEETTAEFRVAPGETFEVPKPFQIGPPAGMEVFKLFATDNPVDLRPVMNSRGPVGHKDPAASPLERLLNQTYLNDEKEIRTRGGRTVNLASGSLHIYSYTFIIDAEQ
ncbi:MAG: caspase family protein [Lewinellaceae bacterium]|nr:caspase family protein [Saprospiraceae bacterium]MCB9331738.1 caspase family protein [Lewinellaceae bacterium]